MNAPIHDWTNRRVWLLGASTGIGAALAQSLLRAGARVAVSARSAGKLAAVVGAAGVTGCDARRTLVLPCDATDDAAVAAATRQIVTAWGGIDVALYVAGDYVSMRAWELDLPRARHLVDINLLGAFAFAASVVPQLLAPDQGEIGFVARVAGYRGLPRSLVYGPTKAALINFAEALALDLQPRGVGVRVINPGFVATPLTAQNDFAMPALQTPEEAAAAILDGYRSRAFEIHFPKRFTRFMKLLALLPARLYLPLIRRSTGA